MILTGLLCLYSAFTEYSDVQLESSIEKTGYVEFVEIQRPIEPITRRWGKSTNLLIRLKDDPVYYRSSVTFPEYYKYGRSTVRKLPKGTKVSLLLNKEDLRDQSNSDAYDRFKGQKFISLRTSDDTHLTVEAYNRAHKIEKSQLLYVWLAFFFLAIHFYYTRFCGEE